MALMGGRRNAYKVLVVTPNEKRPRGRPRRRWEDKINMNHEEMMWGHALD